MAGSDSLVAFLGLHTFAVTDPTTRYREGGRGGYVWIVLIVVQRTLTK